MTYRAPLIIGCSALFTVIFSNVFTKPEVLGIVAPELTPTITITPTVEPTPTDIPPTPTNTPKPTRIPTPTPKPQAKYTSEEIYNMINQYSGEKGVSPDVIRHIAQCESGFRPEARNYIYAGLFQYDVPTWKSFRKMMGQDPDPDLRYDAKEAIKTTVYLVSLGKLYLWPNCHP